VTELWNLGHAYGSIAIELKIAHHYIKHFLKIHGMKRTVEESRALRAKNKISCNRHKKPPIPEDEFRLAMVGCRTNLQLAKKLEIGVSQVISLKRLYGIKWPQNYSHKQYSIYDN